jgi:Retinoic acid induced 16-like protein
MNSLEFCNAVVQVAHSLIREQLLDFLYQGFLVPVLGPALLQVSLCKQIVRLFFVLCSFSTDSQFVKLDF